MRLLLIEGRKLWEVLAVEDEGGESVWTWLLEQNANRKVEKHAEKMRYLLREYVPRNGPPRKRTLGTMLSGTGGIGELKAGPKKGPKLRVLYFFAGERRLICTHGFWKDTKTAQEDIRLAQEVKEAYEQAVTKRVRKLAPHGKRGPNAVSR